MSPPKGNRILAIDFGMARLGLAISDERHILSIPLTALPAGKRLEDTIAHVVSWVERWQREHHNVIQEVVVGFPLLMSGKTGTQADIVSQFAIQLQVALSIPVHLWDERLSTVQADRALRHMSRKKRSKVVDAVSATIILQSYLEGKSQSAG